jgi:hypothetical protein
MQRHSRLLIATAAVFVFAGLALAVPESRQYAADIWSGFDYGNDLETTKREAERLQVVAERLQRSRGMKELLIDQLIDEQMDLEQVSEVFVTLNELNPKTAAYVQAHFPGSTIREKTARQVMGYIRAVLARDPARRKTTLERLELQLRAMNQ